MEDLKKRGFITFATDINQIVMVTTPNSMKFLKFMQGGFTENNVRKWVDKVDCTFGVVKYDKRTKFFGGKMVQSSYQFINTLGLTEAQAEELLKPSKDYLTTIRNDYDFMRYHFSDVSKREKIKDDETEYPEGECEYPLKSIKFNFPIFQNGEEVDEIFLNKQLNVETLVVLSHKKPDSHLEVKIDFDNTSLDKMAISERAEKRKPQEKTTYKNM